MLPGILTQLGQEGLAHLKRLANNVVVGNKILGSVNEEEDDVPNLVENFEETAKEGEKKADTPVAAAQEAVVAEPAAPVADAETKPVEAKVEEVTEKVAEAQEKRTSNRIKIRKLNFSFSFFSLSKIERNCHFSTHPHFFLFFY
jgi:hypothetical protein